VVQIRLSRLEEDFDEAILAAVVAAQRLAFAFEAAGRFWRALLAAPTLLPFFLLVFLLAAAFAVPTAGRDLIDCQSPEDRPERCGKERDQRAAAGTRGTQLPRQGIEALRVHHALPWNMAAIQTPS